MLKLKKKKKKTTASSKDTWKTCTIPGKKKKSPLPQIQERRIIGEMQLGSSLRKKIKAPIVNSLFVE